MSDIKGKVIVITGASSGIGEAAASLLAERGAKVVVGARRTERLEKLAAGIKAKGGEAALPRRGRHQARGCEGFRRFRQGGVRAGRRAGQQCGRHAAVA